MAARTNQGRFTVFDYVGFGFSAASLVWAILAVAVFAPPFAAMFEEFSCCLPRLTELFFTPWFPIALGAVPAAVVALGTFGRFGRGVRGLAMSAAILFTLAQPVVFFAAMYLPIAALAEGIQ
jgi:hypothetical protein